MDLTDTAKVILKSRYLKDAESPEEMFWRVAKTVAQAEPEAQNYWAEQFYNLMTSLDFLPNSPTLMNAGRPLGQLSACFVLPIDDSMDSIFSTLKNMALVQQSGGGTGFSFSRLRPKNSLVRSTGGVASGPVSFLQVYDHAVEAVKQGGTRRGAAIGVLRVDHPDIREFITCKAEEGAIKNFNLSVGITDEFMRAVEEDGVFQLRFGDKLYDKIRARELFDLIVHYAWLNGEPGVLFLDMMNKRNPTPELGEIEASNPCGEQPLLPYESCNLGSVNLSNMVVNKVIDWERLSHTVVVAVRFLDDVIDVNKYPLKEIEEATKRTRKIGLGVMGWADMLFRLGVPYNSKQAVELGTQVMAFIQDEAFKASCELGRYRGCFPAFASSVYRNYDYDAVLHNATCTTIAPTGTISMIANTSSGIEPVFSLVYTKTALEGQKFLTVNPVFEERLHNLFPSEKIQEILERVAEIGSCQGIPELPEDVRKVFVTALEIEPSYHVAMQATFQKYTDNAVSKTINFPYEATEEDIAKAFIQAWRLGCKGLTVYRNGSRQEQVLEVGKGRSATASKLYPVPRPKKVSGFTEQVETGCGKMYVTANSDEHGLVETFVVTGSDGGCRAFTEGISRLVSMALRANIAPEAIIDQLTSVSCSNFLRRKATDKTLVGKSCPDVIGRILAGTLRGGEVQKRSRGFICPDCGAVMETLEGCLACRDCGYSKCD